MSVKKMIIRVSYIMLIVVICSISFVEIIFANSYDNWDEIYKINTAENFLENKEKIDNYIVNTTRWGSKDQVIEYAELLINEPSIGQYKANFLSKVLSRLSRGESK